MNHTHTLFSAESLIRIRRKVDKATKRALAASREAYEAPQFSVAHKAWLGEVTLSAEALRNLRYDNMGCSLTVGVMRGDFSEIFPASIGPTVADNIRPQRVLCAEPESARYIAQWGPDDESAIRAADAFKYRQAIHHETMQRLALA